MNPTKTMFSFWFVMIAIKTILFVVSHKYFRKHALAYLIFTRKKTVLRILLFRGRFVSVVPPQFANASRHLPRQVQSHPCTITGAPGKAYTEKSLQLATPGTYSKQFIFCTFHQPVALYKA